jgi:hypothetical protein
MDGSSLTLWGSIVYLLKALARELGNCVRPLRILGERPKFVAATLVEVSPELIVAATGGYVPIRTARLYSCRNFAPSLALIPAHGEFPLCSSASAPW